MMNNKLIIRICWSSKKKKCCETKTKLKEGTRIHTMTTFKHPSCNPLALAPITSEYSAELLLLNKVKHTKATLRLAAEIMTNEWLTTTRNNNQVVIRNTRRAHPVIFSHFFPSLSFPPFCSLQFRKHLLCTTLSLSCPCWVSAAHRLRFMCHALWV